MRIGAIFLSLGLVFAALASETAGPSVLLFMLLIGSGGLAHFLFRSPLGWLITGLVLVGVIGCKRDE